LEAIIGAGILDVTGQNGRAARPLLGIYYCATESFLY